MQKILLCLTILTLASSAFAASVLSGYTIHSLGTFATTGPGYGGLAADANNVYMVGDGSSQVYKYNISNGTFSAFYSSPTNNNLSLTLYGGDLYVGGSSNGSIYKVNSSGVGSLFTTMGTYVNKMILAPAGWGSYGGQMIVATINGIYALNMSTGVKTTIVGGSSSWDGIAWSSTNELLATRDDASVYKIGSNGTVSTFFSISGELDSLVVHPGTGEIFTTSPSSTIYRTNANGTGTTAFLTGLNFSSGWYPSGIVFSPDGATMYYSEVNGGYKLYSVTGFSSVTPVPEASTVMMMLLALGSSVLLRKRK